MSLEKIIEEKIQEAMATGEFDNLEGAGKPLNLDDYFATPADFRVGYSLLKSNKFLPQEVEIMREIGELKAKIQQTENEEIKRNLVKVLNEKTLALQMILERNKRNK